MAKSMKFRSGGSTDLLVGTEVKTKVVIMSDDRASGLPCESPVFPVGTVGHIISARRATIYIVGFINPDDDDQDTNKVFYDVTEDEIEIVD